MHYTLPSGSSARKLNGLLAAREAIEGFRCMASVFFFESSNGKNKKKRVSVLVFLQNVQRCAVVIVHHGTSIFQSWNWYEYDFELCLPELV